MKIVFFSGPAYAKLIAQKTKGLPKISFPLDKLEAAAATEVRRNVSLALFGAFDTCQSLLVKGKFCQISSYTVFLNKELFYSLEFLNSELERTYSKLSYG